MSCYSLKKFTAWGLWGDSEPSCSYRRHSHSLESGWPLIKFSILGWHPFGPWCFLEYNFLLFNSDTKKLKLLLTVTSASYIVHSGNMHLSLRLSWDTTCQFPRLITNPLCLILSVLWCWSDSTQGSFTRIPALKTSHCLGQGLTCGTVDILGQVTLCCRYCPVPCGAFGSTFGLRCQYPLP